MPILEFVAPTPADAPLPEDTWHLAELIALRVDDKVSKDGEKYQRISWKFSISDPGGEYDGRTCWGDTGAKPVAAADCKLWVWSQEMFGTELPQGYALDTDDLIGKKVQVRIGHRNYVKDGESKVYVFVADLMRTSVNAGVNTPGAPTSGIVASGGGIISAEEPF